ncbi:restriction endonuclease subunit S [Luteimonas sp. A482]
MRSENKSVQKSVGYRTSLPKLRFPEFDGWWESRPLSQVARIAQGGTPSTGVAKYWGGDVQWVTPAEMGKDASPYISKTVRTITEEGLQNCSSEVLPPESTILSTRAPIGHLAINAVPMAMNQGCRGFVSKEGFDGKFLYFSLARSKAALERLGAGNTFKELSGGVLKSFELAFPSQREQQKVGNVLSTLDDRIGAEARKLDTLRAHKQGLMQQLFPDEGQPLPCLRFPGFVGRWKVQKLENTIVTVTPPKKLQTSQYMQEGAYPIIDQSAKPIAGWTDDSCGLVAGPFPLIVFGDHTCVLKLANKPFVQGADGIKILRAKKDVSTAFLFQCLQANPIVMLDYRRHFSQLKEMMVKFPEDPDEQLRIADLLANLDVLIRAQVEMIELLRQHKKGLMQRLLPLVEADAP